MIVKEINMVSKEVLKDKPKGAMFWRNGHYFKIYKNKPYYYHHSQKKWFVSITFTCSELMSFYKC